MSKSVGSSAIDTGLATGDELDAVKNAIIVVQGRPVILAHDLAQFFDTETTKINRYRSRNSERFITEYAFQLTENQWKNLISQNGIASSTHGGVRIRPWAYTEHGVAMMSMGMRSVLPP